MAIRRQPFRFHHQKKSIADLLQHFANGELEDAKKMIQENQEFLSTKGTFTEHFSDDPDYPHRTFEGITALQLACWYLDKPACEMLMDCFDAKNMKDEAVKQLKEIESNSPPSYIKKYGKHYDFTLIIILYQVYIKFCEDHNTGATWDTPTMQAAGKIWKLIGEEQRKFPNSLISEFTRPDQSFKTVPKFDGKDLPRDCKVLDETTDTRKKWHQMNLGRPVAQGEPVCSSRVFRGGNNEASNGCAKGGIKLDLNAVIQFEIDMLNYFEKELPQRVVATSSNQPGR